MDLVEEIKHLKTVTIVKFEDLVTYTIETTKKICDWLNIKFEERILKGSEYNFIYSNKPIDPQKA